MSQVWAAYKWGELSKRFPCDLSQISEYSEMINSEMTPSRTHCEIIQECILCGFITGYFSLSYVQLGIYFIIRVRAVKCTRFIQK